MSSAEQVFKDATLYTDDELYRVIQLPAAALWAGAAILAEIGAPFSALIADKDEITLIVLADAWDDVGDRLPNHTVLEQAYRLITFDLPLAPDLVGFMALVSRILADTGVSILPLAAFSRDHILVTDAQFQRAWDALTAAQRG